MGAINGIPFHKNCLPEPRGDLLQQQRHQPPTRTCCGCITRPRHRLESMMYQYVQRERLPRCAPMRSLHTSLLPTWLRDVTSGKIQAAGAKTMTKPTREST